MTLILQQYSLGILSNYQSNRTFVINETSTTQQNHLPSTFDRFTFLSSSSREPSADDETEINNDK